MGYSIALRIFTSNSSNSFNEAGGKNSKDAEVKLRFDNNDIKYFKKKFKKKTSNDIWIQIGVALGYIRAADIIKKLDEKKIWECVFTRFAITFLLIKNINYD